MLEGLGFVFIFKLICCSIMYLLMWVISTYRVMRQVYASLPSSNLYEIVDDSFKLRTNRRFSRDIVILVEPLMSDWAS
jgi:hypothetical protein